EIAAGSARIGNFSAAHDAGWDDPERLLSGVEIGELAGKRIHQAFGDGFVRRIVANVVEGKDRDVVFAGFTGKQSGGALANGRDEQRERCKNDEAECGEKIRSGTALGW